MTKSYKFEKGGGFAFTREQSGTMPLKQTRVLGQSGFVAKERAIRAETVGNKAIREN